MGAGDFPRADSLDRESERAVFGATLSGAGTFPGIQHADRWDNAGYKFVHVVSRLRQVGKEVKQREKAVTRRRMASERELWLDDPLEDKGNGFYERALLAQSGLVDDLRVPRTGLGVFYPATMDRLLSEERLRLELRGRSRSRPGMMLKHRVPIRTFADWNEVVPGFFEMDMVSHAGGHPTGGRFIHSLDATDIATCWIALEAVINKEAGRVLSAIEEVRERCPFDLKGIDTDGGGEFINNDLISWCRDNRITFTRSRPWRKNESCYVEQENHSVVRRLLGYAKHDILEELEVIRELCSYAPLYVNFFQPTQKMVKKERVGSRVIKAYDEAKTPYQRVLASPHVSKKVKRELAKEYEGLNPVDLKRLIGELQLRLMELAAFKGRTFTPEEEICGLDRLIESLDKSEGHEHIPV